MKKMPVLRRIVIMMIVIVTVFVVVNIMWFYMYISIYKPILNNPKIVLDDSESSKCYSYSFDTENTREYGFFLKSPKYLKFWGSLQMSHPMIMSETGGFLDTGRNVDIVCYPKIFKKDKLFIRVFSNDSNEFRLIEIRVDENLELLSDVTYSPEEQQIYNECIDEARKNYKVFTDFFDYQCN